MFQPLPVARAEQSDVGSVGKNTCHLRAAGALTWYSKRARHALPEPLDVAAARKLGEEPLTPACVLG